MKVAKTKPREKKIAILKAVEEPRQDVPADPVGPEEMAVDRRRRVRRVGAVAEVLLVGVVGHDGQDDPAGAVLCKFPRELPVVRLVLVAQAELVSEPDMVVRGEVQVPLVPDGDGPRVDEELRYEGKGHQGGQEPERDPRPPDGPEPPESLAGQRIDAQSHRRSPNLTRGSTSATKKSPRTLPRREANELMATTPRTTG